MNQDLTSELNILVVDFDADQESLRNILISGLKTFTISLDLAATYEEAIACIDNSSYDVFLFEYHLGVHSGIELLRSVRMRNLDTPIIFITDNGDEQLAVNVLKSGACDYLIKSKLSKELLCSSIRYAVELHHKEKQRQSAEVKLQKSYQELERRVEERTLELAMSNERLHEEIIERQYVEEAYHQALKQAEQANNSKRQFLANMSHEIRTPMNGVIGLTDLVLSRDLAEEQRRFVEMIKVSANRLLEVVNDILDFSKIEAGKLEINPIPFNLRDMLDNPLKMLAVKAQDKGVELIYQVKNRVPDNLIGDPGRLRQIIVNLVGNAIKFTDVGEVVVRVDLLNDFPLPPPTAPVDPAKAGEVLLTFEIEDTGIGISTEHLESIFQAFTQADNISIDKHGGTGLGLAICSQLVSLMGGEIQVESTPGKGARFIFFCRLQLQETQPARQELLPVRDLRNVALLLAVRSHANRLILKEILSGWIGDIVAVDSGAKAKSLSEEQKFAVVVISSDLQDIDGYSLARSIKADSKSQGPRLIMLTNAGQRGDAERCRAIGIDAYLMKPVSQVELLQTLRSVLGFAPHIPEDFLKYPLVTRHYLREHQQGMKILLAEDDEINTILAINLLEEEGFQVTAVQNGLEAVQYLQNNDIELILMDVQMPVKDGFAATRMIRSWGLADSPVLVGKSSIPIIAMTAHAMKGDREKCLEQGMDGYIPKPFETRNLVDEIRRVLQRQMPDGAVFREHNPEIFQPLDYDRLLLAKCKGREDLAHHLLNILMHTSIPQWLQETAEAIASENKQLLYNLGHTIKGSAATLHASELAEAGKKLEKSSLLGEKEGIEEAHILLQKAYINLQTYCRHQGLLDKAK